MSQLAAVSSGRHSTNDRDSGDQFIFMLPYAGTFIKWRLLFCAEYRNYPPDFLCLTEDFYYDPEIYTKIMQSWDYNDKNCLANLLKQLLSVYKDYQVLTLYICYNLFDWFSIRFYLFSSNTSWNN